MALLIDEAWAKVNPVAAKSVGYTGIIGYVSQDVTGKNWTQGTLNAARAAGLDVGVVYEFDPKSALGGAYQGAHDAGIAVQGMHSLGFPVGVCCYAAVDWDVQPSEMDAVRNYMLAFQAHMAAFAYRAGIYGGYNVCNMLHAFGWTGLLWQTYAWSGGRWLAATNVRQILNGTHVAGANVDEDTSQTVDWGQWSADGRYPQGTVGGDMSVVTDNIVKAWSVGNPSTVDEVGHRIDIAPVTWEINREAWERNVSTMLSALTTAIAKIGVASAVLTDQEAADLHTIASVLKPPAV